jgi:hypothetical protein
MFGLFKKKPSLQESINSCLALANNANIDVVMKEGNYSGFLIFLDEDTLALTNHFKHQEALSAFVGKIEEKISRGQFNDPGADAGMVSEIRAMTGWKPNMAVVRAVIARDDKPVFRWEP